MILLITHSVFAQKKEARAQRADTVFVTGMIETPLVLSMSDFAGLRLKDPGIQQVVNDKGEVKKKLKGLSGILLKDVIAQAKVKMDTKKEQGKYLVVITATDGYQAVFAYNELIYGPAADATWLLMGNDSVMNEDGPFSVFCASDKVTGPRYIKWVKNIEVRKI